MSYLLVKKIDNNLKYLKFISSCDVSDAYDFKANVAFVKRPFLP